MFEIHDHDAKKINGKSPIIATMDTEAKCIEFIKKAHLNQKVTLDPPPFGPGKLVSINGIYRYFVGPNKDFKPNAGFTLHVECRKCHQLTGVVMTQEQAVAYGKSEHGTIASIFPDKDMPTQRLLSIGICPKCW
jgi:hypothetical protein